MSKKNKRKGKKFNKVFNNDYNTGNLDFEFFGDIRIKTEISDIFTDGSYSDYERSELRDELYEIFKESDFYEKYSKIKKVSKNDMQTIYYYFVGRITPNKYTNIQIFTEVCEFMKLDYKEMFQKIMPIEKQKIISELDREFDVVDKKNIKRLF